MADEQREPSEPERRARNQAGELLGRARATHSSVERANSALAGSPSTEIAAIIAQLNAAEVQLALMVDAPGSSVNADLSGLEQLIQGSETAAGAVVRAAVDDALMNVASMQATSQATRAEVQGLVHDMYDRHIFEPYMHFGSPAEEAEYRAHEAARQQRIAELLAQHTPGGDLRAGGEAAGGMMEAAEHGAANSPEFMSRWTKLTAQLHKQREAVVATRDTANVAKFDEQVRCDVRSFLEHRKPPVSADKIAQVLASADPLQAVTPYLDPKQTRELEAQLQRSAASSQRSDEGSAGPASPSGTAAPAVSGQPGQPAPSPSTAPAASEPVSPTPSAPTPPARAQQIAMALNLDDIGFDAATPAAGDGHGLPDQARSSEPRPSGRAV